METMRVKDIPCILWYMLTAARILYAQLWKQKKIPDIWHWIKKKYYR